MNNKIFASVMSLAFALTPIAAYADACNCDTTSSPSTPSNSTTNVGTVNNGASANSSNGTNTTVTTPQTQNNNTSSVANPLASNINNQVNNNFSSQASFGGGVQCASTSLALSGSEAAQNSPGYASTNAYNLNASLIIPIGGKVNNNCTTLSTEIVLQRQIGTCTEIFHDGFDIDQNVAPALFARCSMLKRHVEVAVSPPPVVVQAPTPVRLQPEEIDSNNVENISIINIAEGTTKCDSQMTTREMINLATKSTYLAHHRLGPQSQELYTKIRKRLSQYCEQDRLSQVLDANGSQLP